MSTQTKGSSFFRNILLIPYSKLNQHFIVQVLILLVTLPVFLDSPYQLVFTPARVLVWSAYYAVINILVYFSYYFFISRHLLKNYRTRITVVLLVCLVVLLLLSVQGLIINNENMQLPVFRKILIMLSSLIYVGFVVTGISVILIYEPWTRKKSDAINQDQIEQSQELTLLKNHINGEFLFDVLSRAIMKIRDMDREASDVVSKLGCVLRYQLSDNDREDVLFEEEIEYLHDYLYIIQIQEENFHFTITEKGDTRPVSIPFMLFTPFIENAVIYSRHCEGDPFVHISFTVGNNRLEFICESAVHPDEEIELFDPATTIENDDAIGDFIASNYMSTILEEPDPEEETQLENIRPDAKMDNLLDETGPQAIAEKSIHTRLELLYPGKYILHSTRTGSTYKVTLEIELP